MTVPLASWRLAEILDYHSVASAPFIANSVVLRGRINVRRIDYVDFILISSGTGRVITEDAVESPLKAGHLCFFRPTDQHELQGFLPDGLAMFVVSVSVARWSAFAGFTGVEPALDPTADPIVVSVDPHAPDVHDPFDRVVSRFQDHPTGLDLANFLCAATPLLGFRSRDELPLPNWLVTAIEGMRCEENLRVGVPRLIDLSHVSSRHLAQTVRRYLGTTPTGLVAEMRMRHAALLLSSSGGGVSEIARRCGFATHAHFSHMFQRYFGCTPSEYRLRAQ